MSAADPTSSPATSSAASIEAGDMPLFVTIIVKPFRVEPVLRALSALRIPEIALTQVRGYGRQKGHLELYRGSEYHISFIPKVKIDLCLGRSQLEEMLRAVEAAGRTGRIGDGKIFVLGAAGLEDLG